MYVACVDYDSYDGKLSVEKDLATKSTLMPKVSNPSLSNSRNTIATRAQKMCAHLSIKWPLQH